MPTRESLEPALGSEEAQHDSHTLPNADTEPVRTDQDLSDGECRNVSFMSSETLEHAAANEHSNDHVSALKDPHKAAATLDPSEKANIEDAMSDGSIDRIEEHSWRMTRHPKDLAERRRKASKRAMQYSEYIELLEDRVSYMEERLDQLRNGSSALIAGDQSKLPNLPTPEDDAESTPSTRQLRLDIAHLTWNDFIGFGTSSKHVIEVLKGDVSLFP